MKRLQLSGAMLGLTVLLTACPGPTPPAPTQTLTLKLEGVASAPVVVTNTTTNAQVFKGTLEGTKTFGDLKAGDVFKVEGEAVAGYTAPAAQTVTLDADKTVTLTYTAVPQPEKTHSLTVRVEGVPSAPVTVTNTTTNAEVFKGTLEGSKTFGNLKAGNVFKVEGGAVSDYATPTAQTVTLDGDKTVALGYKVLPGTALDPARVRGTLSGWTFGTGTLVVFGNGGTPVEASTPTISAPGTVDAGLPTPTSLSPFLSGCTFTGERSALDFNFDFASPAAFSSQGDFLGGVSERTTDGSEVIRVYSDTTAQFKGVAICSGTTRLDLDIQVVRGWNAIALTALSSGSYRDDYQLRSLSAGTRTTLTLQRADERVEVLFRDQSSLTLRAGEQASRAVVFGQTGGISGQVTLETDVPGVTVTPTTLDLPALSAASRGASKNQAGLAALAASVQPQALSTSLTLRADAKARGYNGPLSVIVKKGGVEVGRGVLYSFSLRSPYVSVSVANAYNPVNVYQGETGSVEVNVTSADGFDGPTTLTLADLPVGVTATPVTVQVSPGTTTTVKVPITAAADAALGTTPVRVTSPDSPSNSMGSPNTFQLSVRPGRTVLTGGASALAPATQGVWVLGNSTYDSGTGTSRTPLNRYLNGAAVTTVNVAGSGSSLLALPSGEVLVFGGYDGVNNASRVNDAGTVTPLTAPTGAGSGVVDGQGRVWYIKRAFSGMGGVSTTVERWDPATGANVTVDNTRDFGYNQGQWWGSNNGNHLVYLSLYSGGAIRVDTATNTITTLSPAPSGQSSSVAISDNGTLWYSEYGRLKRVNADGSVTSFDSLSNVPTLIGFDRASPQVLWASSSSDALKIDTSTATPTATVIPLGGPARGVTLRDGGAAVVTNEYDSTTGNTRPSLSILR